MTASNLPEFGSERSGAGISDLTLESLFSLEAGNDARIRTEQAFEVLHNMIGLVELLGDTSIHIQQFGDTERRTVFKTVQHLVNGVEFPFYRIVVNDIHDTAPDCRQVTIHDYSVSCSHDCLAYQKSTASVLREGDDEIIANTSTTGPMLLVRDDRLLVDYGAQYRPLLPEVRERLTLEEELARRARATELTDILSRLGPASRQAQLRLGILPPKH